MTHPLHRPRLHCLALAVTVVTALAAAPSAFAGAVSGTSPNFTYTAAAGEANNLTVTRTTGADAMAPADDELLFTDSGTIGGGPIVVTETSANCTASTNTVTCIVPATTTVALTVNLA